jgi:hypothetical protein
VRTIFERQLWRCAIFGVDFSGRMIAGNGMLPSADRDDNSVRSHAVRDGLKYTLLAANNARKELTIAQNAEQIRQIRAVRTLEPPLTDSEKSAIAVELSSEFVCVQCGLQHNAESSYLPSTCDSCFEKSRHNKSRANK